MLIATLELPWTQQPPPYTPLYLRNPINRRLQILAYGGGFARTQGPAYGGLPYLHSHQGPLTPYSGSPTIRAHRDGFGPVFAGGDQSYITGLGGNDLGGAFTIEVVCRITAVTALSGFFGNIYAGKGLQRGLIAYGGGSNKNIYFYGGSADLDSGVQWREDGSLQHVFVTSEGSGQPMRFYRDGVLIASGTTPTLSTPDNGFWIVGSLNWGQSPVGSIGKAAFYNRALSRGEVLALTNSMWLNFEPHKFDIAFTPASSVAPTLISASVINIASTSVRARITFSR